MKSAEKTVVLIGPPGAGKTTVGGLLARRLKRAFVDTDQLIEVESGRKISDIFIEDGEGTFRAIEESVITKILSEFQGVVSLGGGSILSQNIRALLENSKSSHTIFFLDVSISNAAPRVGFNKERPLLMINPRAQWQELMNKRRPIYLSIADESVDTNNLSPDEVVDEIVKRLEA
jgi:shikimate kinase